MSIMSKGGARAVLALCLALGSLFASAGVVWRQRATSRVPEPPFDPLAQALASGSTVANREAPIPSMCYTKTEGVSNPCWTCHSGGVGFNVMDDESLQADYAFSDVGLLNQWSNLFADRTAAQADISDDEVLEYIREDNYAPLRESLLQRPGGFKGWVPDLNLARGFDAEGFALDGSGWRAVRYKPFLGTFWPTNGNTDDIFIRIPEAFRRDSEGRLSPDVYRLNLAILEAAMTVDPGLRGREWGRRAHGGSRGGAWPAEDIRGRRREGRRAQGLLSARRRVPAHREIRGPGCAHVVVSAHEGGPLLAQGRGIHGRAGDGLLLGGAGEEDAQPAARLSGHARAGAHQRVRLAPPGLHRRREGSPARADAGGTRVLHGLPHQPGRDGGPDLRLPAQGAGQGRVAPSRPARPPRCAAGGPREAGGADVLRAGEGRRRVPRE